jgi:hypothetical protein
MISQRSEMQSVENAGVQEIILERGKRPAGPFLTGMGRWRVCPVFKVSVRRGHS